jgi:opacity protein-like surface antigen
MKRSSVAVLALGGLLALGAGSAQAQSGLTFGLGGGVTLPTGDFADFSKSLGWQGTAIVGYQPAGNLGARVDFLYGQTKFDEDETAGLGGKTTLAGGLASLVYRFPVAGSVKPYLVGGAGVYNVKTDPDALPSDDETKFAAGGGLGIKFKAGSDAQFFVEGRFINVFTSGDDANFIPLTVGITFATH